VEHHLASQREVVLHRSILAERDLDALETRSPRQIS
jgi:hypothetical protein